jgi:hypothetical protein
MLLIRRNVHTDDRGVAMVAVIGLMTVALLITALVMTSVISALSHSTSTRAGVQAQAAAESGTAAALAGIQTAGSCAAVNGVYESTTEPFYRATVWHGTEGAWVQGCPTGSGQVRIISTGQASSGGIASNSSQDVAFLESVYAVGGTTASGSAIYMAGTTSLTNFSVLAGTGTLGTVKLPSGNFSCDSATVIQGDVIVAAGNATITNTCTVTGSLRVSGSVTLSASAQIQGDVVASGGGVRLENSTTYVKGSVYANGKVYVMGVIDGSVEATGNAELQGSGAWIKGSLTAGGTIERIEGKIGGSASGAGTGKTTFVPSSKVGGDLSVGGDLDTWNIDYNKPSSSASNNEKYAYGIKANGWVTGAVTYKKSGLTVPVAKTAPTVPAWVDWSYKWSDWAAAGFTDELVWPSALGCKIDNYNSVTTTHALYPYIQKLRNITKNTVVNTLGCSKFEFCNCGNVDLKFGADVAFVGNAFVLGAVKFDSNSTTDRKAWFLVPDQAPTTAGRQCKSPSGSIEMYGASMIGPHLAATIYTPCGISMNNKSLWRGQIYGGSMSMSAGDSLTYLPVGIPGTNLDGATAGTTPGGLGSMISSRNRLNDGE